jgi:uncharacterized repeat protein (TIGR03803 family)
MQHLKYVTVLVFLCSSITVFSQTDIWGITPFGGDAGNGTIFSFDGSIVKKEFSLRGEYPGKFPQYVKLTEGADGKFYGTTSKGGTYGAGVLFEYDRETKAYTVLHHFTNQYPTPEGTAPRAGVMQASNGKLYGVAMDMIYEFDLPTKTYKALHNFQHALGSVACENLVEGDNNTLLGMTVAGGTYDQGVLFEYNIPTDTYAVKFHFGATIANGMHPMGGLMRASNGKFYGMTAEGGNDDRGTIFEYDQSTSQLTTRKFFGRNNDGYADGRHPYSSMIEHPNGKLYGTTIYGGNWGVGTIFEYDLATNQVRLLTIFNFSVNNPIGGVTLAPNGHLYGVNYGGLLGNSGIALYHYDLTQEKFVYDVHNIGATKGPLLLASDGNLYGVAETYGSNSSGSLFRFDLSGPTPSGETLFSFDFSTEGANPYGDLTQAYNGKFYGMTNIGGPLNGGVIFEYDPVTKEYQHKHHFLGSEQSLPRGGFTLHPNGKLYAMITNGGHTTGWLGAVVEFDPEQGVVTNKAAFDELAGNTLSEASFGSRSYCKLLLAPNGKMYGLASTGGTNSIGTIFEYDPAEHTIVKKYDFVQSIGAKPNGSFMLASDGKIYGTAREGGTYESGTIFEYNYITNVVTKKVDFEPYTGIYPEGTLVEGDDQVLYVTTAAISPFTNTSSALMKYNLQTGVLENVATLVGHSNGRLLNHDGKLYGMEMADPMGMLFEFNPQTNERKDIHGFTGPDGAWPEYIALTKRRASQSITPLTSSLEASYGDVIDLSSVATLSSEKTLYGWSMNNDIAEVSDGKIIVKGVGTATILLNQFGDDDLLPAESKEVQLHVAKATLQVKAPQVTKKYKESMPETSPEYSGFVNDEGVDVLNASPTIICEATVSSNVGVYPITLSGGDDDHYSYTFVEGSLEVTKADQTITFLPLDNGAVEESLTLSAETTSGLPVSFSSGDISIATIQGNILIPIAPGTVEIKASQEGNQNYTAAEDVIRVLTVELVTSISDQVVNKLSVFPNPTTNYLSIKNINDAVVTIVDLLGNVVLKVRYTSDDPIDVSSLGAGFYLVKIGNTFQRIEKL